MKKVLFLMAMLPMMLLSACSDDDDNNDYENALTGSWIEDTDSDFEVLHLIFKADKTGTMYATDNGEVNENGKRAIAWSATQNQITIIDKKSGDSETLTYVLSGNNLQIEEISYVRQ